MTSGASPGSNMASQSIQQNPTVVLDSLPASTSGSTQEHRGTNDPWAELEKQSQSLRDSPDPEQPQHVFSEGGRTAWLTVVGSFMIFFATFGMISSFGVYESFYVTRHLVGRSASDVAWIGSLQVCLLFLTGVAVGKAFDEGYFHHLMITGSILEVFGLFMLSVSKTYTQIFLSQGLCVGLGMGFIFLPGIGIIQHHFHQRRALATGLAASGSGVGGIVLSIMMNNMFKPESKIGFANGCRIVAGVVAVVLLVANLTMKTALPPRRLRKDQPPLPNPLTFIKDVDFLFVMFGIGLSMISLYFPVVFIQLDAELHGVNHELAFYLLTIYNAASIPGRILPNYIADRVGVLNIIIICTASCSFITLGMLGINKETASTACIVIAALYGFFSGAVVGLWSPVLPSVSRGPHEYGMRFGMVFLIMGPCGLLSGPIAGWLLGKNFHWEAAIAFSAALTMTSAMLLGVARHIISRSKRTWAV